MQGPTELSLDPRSREGDFATLTGGEGVVTLGGKDQAGTDATARTAAVTAMLSGYDFRVYARTAALAFFAQEDGAVVVERLGPFRSIGNGRKVVRAGVTVTATAPADGRRQENQHR